MALVLINPVHQASIFSSFPSDSPGLSLTSELQGSTNLLLSVFWQILEQAFRYFPFKGVSADPRPEFKSQSSESVSLDHSSHSPPSFPGMGLPDKIQDVW